MTPRQTQAYLSLAADERRVELGEILAVHALAASGDADAIKQQLKQLSEEA